METQEIVRFTVAGRTYELVSFLKEGEIRVKGSTVAKRAKKLNANLGEEDGRFIKRNWSKVHPKKFRKEFRKFRLIFTAWRRSWEPPGDPLQNVAYLTWIDCWYQGWHWPRQRHV